MSCIESETFEYFRIQEKVKAIRKSINILKSHGYTIVDLEGKIIDNQNEDNIKTEYLGPFDKRLLEQLNNIL